MSTTETSTAKMAMDDCTPISEIASLVEQQRKVALSGKTHSIEWRKSQIRSILRMIDEHFDPLANAIKADLGQGEQYTELFELTVVRNMAYFALNNLDKWTKTERVSTPFPANVSQPLHSELTCYPRGLVLVISPWNFPISLLLMPLLGLLSAGCNCILKPSEVSVHTTTLISGLLVQYLDPDALKIVLGGVEQATELLKHRFDAISYTGGTRVGRVVAAAAARHLTPTLLELGGKNPTIVCEDADIESAAMRICFGKFVGNMGQLCINADYVLVVEGMRDKLITSMIKCIKRLYGDDPKQSKDIGRLITKQHAKRVTGLIDSTCKVLYGGSRHDEEDRYVEPTIVEATAASTIMQEEIFGPVLAVITVPDTDSAIRFVKENFTAKGEHPLMLYIFSKSKKNQRKVMDSIQSGLCCVNHVLLNGGNLNLPFGGVGTSGMNAHYGKFGFDFFSHKRGAVVVNNFNSNPNEIGNWLLTPPYTKTKIAIIRFLGKSPLYLGNMKVGLKICLPIILGLVVYRKPTLLTTIGELNINTILGWIRNLLPK